MEPSAGGDPADDGETPVRRGGLSPRARKLFRVLHRDIGYFLTGLVVLYCVSGIAVNHIDEWNPSYSTTTRELRVDPPLGIAPPAAFDLQVAEDHLAARVPLAAAEIRGRRRAGPATFVVFLPNGGEVRWDLTARVAKIKRVTPRPGLFQANVLHLNHLKGIWTYVADAFAVLLLFLALSGLVMLPGKNGFWGRGKWFFLAGLVVPVVALVAYYQKS